MSQTQPQACNIAGSYKDVSEMAVKDMKLGLEKRTANTAWNTFSRENMKNISPYIVLVLVIMLFLGWTFCRPKRRRPNSGVRKHSLGRWIDDKILTPLEILIKPGYKFRQVIHVFTPLKGNTKSLPRNVLSVGRCDNQNWIQLDGGAKVKLTADRSKGSCFAATRPKDIVWNMDISKMPEYNDLSAETQRELDKKLKVFIPYGEGPNNTKSTNTFFVPFIF